MGSTQRNDTGVAIFLERLLRAWEKRRDLTFGQLLYEALLSGDQPMDVVLNLRRLEDHQIAEAVERFVLTGPVSMPSPSRE